MKVLAAIALLAVLASPVSAGVIWDESINGNLSTNPAAPTPIVFAPGGNTIIGTVANINAQTRDYITFTIPDGQTLTSLNLLAFSPDNIGFSAFNAGSTSVVPSNTTNDFFMSGIHVSPADVGFDLLEFFQNRSVTVDALQEPQIDPGTYCFLIQQTSPLVTSYSLEFVITAPVATEPTTWGAIKALYR
jgi:hypothetical protein